MGLGRRYRFCDVVIGSYDGSSGAVIGSYGGALKIRWAHTGSLRLIKMIIGRGFLRAGAYGTDASG